MKLARLGTLGREIPVVITDSTTFDLSALTSDIDGRFLESNGIERVVSALKADELPELSDADTLRFGAPIARPSAVICVGQNYVAHAAESGSPPPESPIIFLKTPNTVVGPNDVVSIPRTSINTDQEVELGVVFKKQASYLDSPSESINFIAGFVTANDLSEREFQLERSGGQWSKGKSAPGFSPIGPWLVTPDELDYTNLHLRSWVNGEPRQDSTTAEMIFGVDFLVWHLSQYLTFEPGDLLLTGTPKGVALSGKFPYLKPGDVVEIEIEGLGRQRQEFIKS